MFAKSIEEALAIQAHFAKSLRFEDIPSEVVRRAQCVILDSLGCVIKGNEMACKSDGEQNDDIDPALRNALSMISTELYEGNRKAIGHPACHILPLMFVQTQSGKISHKEFIKNFVAAYEIAARWGSAITFSHDILGHGTVMTSGAVVAEGLYRDAGEETIYNALLITGSLPEVSVWQSVWDGSALHDAYAGISACKARMSYDLERSGVRSSGKMVESVYHDVMGASIAPDKLSAGLGETYLLLSNYYKVHTGCRFVHPFADIIKEELEKGLNPADIDTIDIYTYKKAARLTAQHVPNKLAGQFSIPVSIAVQLETGELSPDTIACCVDDPDILAWEGRITLYEDEAYNALLPDTRAGRVEFHKKDGLTYVRETCHAVGDFDHPIPFTEDDVISKFKGNVKGMLSSEEVDDIIKNILRKPGIEPLKIII